MVTVNSEIFARILFSRIELKDIFAMIKFALIACFTYISKRQFARILFLRSFTYAKFRENKILTKISGFAASFQHAYPAMSRDQM